MDLLGTILRTCNAEEYLENFKNSGIDSFTLKILTDEDLALIGIDSEEKRSSLLNYINNLQIPGEKKANITVDKQFVQLVLNQTSLQLHKHYANLICIMKRDVDLCSIKVTPFVSCLENTLEDLEKELHEFERTVIEVPRKKKKKINILLPTIVITVLSLFVCRHYLKN